MDAGQGYNPLREVEGGGRMRFVSKEVKKVACVMLMMA
jgi:hypothetical protein